jgi:DNA-binding transcriptional LysR family regulator
MLSRLRDQFGDGLLVKQGRGLVPTPRARALREPLKLALGGMRAMLEPPPAFAPSSATRCFRILTSDYAHVVMLGGVLDDLRIAAAGVTIVAETPGNDAFERLAGGAVDLVLAPPEVCPRWARAQTVLGDRWACVRRRGEALPATLNGYLALEHVDVGIEKQFGGAIAAGLASRSSRRRVRAQVADFAGALFVVAQSQLLATVPAPVAMRGCSLLPLAMSPVPFKLPSPEVAMIWPRRLDDDPAHAWFRQKVLQAVGRAES